MIHIRFKIWLIYWKFVIKFILNLASLLMQTPIFLLIHVTYIVY